MNKSEMNKSECIQYLVFFSLTKQSYLILFVDWVEGNPMIQKGLVCRDAKMPVSAQRKRNIRVSTRNESNKNDVSSIIIRKTSR